MFHILFLFLIQTVLVAHAGVIPKAKFVHQLNWFKLLSDFFQSWRPEFLGSDSCASNWATLPDYSWPHIAFKGDTTKARARGWSKGWTETRKSCSRTRISKALCTLPRHGNKLVWSIFGFSEQVGVLHVVMSFGYWLKHFLGWRKYGQSYCQQKISWANWRNSYKASKGGSQTTKWEFEAHCPWPTKERYIIYRQTQE